MSSACTVDISYLHSLPYLLLTKINTFLSVLNINNCLSKAEAFRTLMNSLQQVRAQLVVRFVHGKIQLIETENNCTTIRNLYRSQFIKLTKCALTVSDRLNDRPCESGISAHRSYLPKLRILVKEPLTFQLRIEGTLPYPPGRKT